jgi:hypothetical protein
MAASLRWTVFAAACCAALLFAVEARAEQRVVVAASPEPLLAVPTPAPAPKPVTLHDKVVAALRAANHYGALSGFLDSVAANSLITEGTTLFAPDDGAFSGMNMNSSSLLMTTLDYHVATEVYTYNQLSNMALNTTLQTAAPNVVIFVTSTGKSGLRLDNVAITDPDIYSDGQMSVQGVSAVMDAALYNKALLPPTAAPAPAPVVAHVPAAAPTIITTPSTPKTSAGTTPSPNAAPAHVLITVVNSVLPVFAVSFLVALL